MTVKGKLYLVPCPIAEKTLQHVIPSSTKERIGHIRLFLVEDLPSARRFLSSAGIKPEEIEFQVLNKYTRGDEAAAYLQPLLKGADVGVISEAGVPGVADPGALATRFAHHHDIQVIPLVGPSSIILALMGSGLNGQQFAFHGYLPRDEKELSGRIRELERESRQKRQTQIFIETPHRNNSLFGVLLKTLQSETQLTIAMDLTGEGEYLKTRAVKEWRAGKIQWPKSPAVFLFLAE
jgi:16S rRNA (cytidine1402-2'-O)-methyltransferase